MTALILSILLAASSHAKKTPPDPRTAGLGGSCKVNKDCKGKTQRCIHEVDVNNKPVAVGFCVLPCAPLDAGTTKVVPGAPLDPSLASKDRKIPPRCPKKYQCREAGQGVSFDMCVKE